MTGPSSAPGLERLVGFWRGRGVADFPTIDRVEYTEELAIEWDREREVFCYEQRAVLLDGTASHRETGFLRTLADGLVEVWNAQDNGRTEVLRGTSSWDPSAEELLIDVRSETFGNDPRMVESRRLFTVGPERLLSELSMTTTTTPEPVSLPHLRCDLTRITDNRSEVDQ